MRNDSTYSLLFIRHAGATGTHTSGGEKLRKRRIRGKVCASIEHREEEEEELSWNLSSEFPKNKSFDNAVIGT